MANEVSLKLRFGTLSGVKTWTFKHAKANPQASNVKTLMDTMISNGSIYKYPPMTKQSAEVVETSTYVVDIDD